MFQVLVKAAGASATLALLVDSSDTAALVAQKYALATRGNAYKNIETVSMRSLPHSDHGSFSNLAFLLNFNVFSLPSCCRESSIAATPFH